MTRSILKAMECPNYLWGEAVRHATYLINRVATRVLEVMTPYEALKKKKPNVGHIRVFGCIGYTKVDTPHLKKLDDRSQILVHLGTEPGSKAYRLYDPMSRKIIVSRDVIFDENKMGNWKRSTEHIKKLSPLLLVNLEIKASIEMFKLLRKRVKKTMLQSSQWTRVQRSQTSKRRKM